MLQRQPPAQPNTHPSKVPVEELMLHPHVQQIGFVCPECGNDSGETLCDNEQLASAGATEFRNTDLNICGDCGLIMIYMNGEWQLMSDRMFAFVRDHRMKASDLFIVEQQGLQLHNVPAGWDPQLFRRKDEPTLDDESGS